MAQITQTQVKTVADYEKTLEHWLGEVKKEDIDKVLAKMGEWGKLPYAGLLNLFLEMCSRCGTCANECHVYKTYPQKEFSPAYRAQLLRSVYLRHFTLMGKIFGSLIAAKELDEKMLKEWFIRFYECNVCRRCHLFCPFGIDSSVLVRMGRNLISEVMGKTSPDMAKGVDLQLKTGNTAGIKEAAFYHTIKFVEEEIKEKKGWEIKIPIDKIGAEIYLLPVNTDFLISLDSMAGMFCVFHAVKADWTISSKMFDVVNYGQFYDDGIRLKIMKMHVEEAKRLKCKTLVAGECGHALRVLFRLAPITLKPLPFQVKSILQVTADYIKQGKLKLNKEKNPEPVTYHDPCNVSRMCGVIEEPREILRAVCKDFREMTPNREKNFCCGGGGGMVLETGSLNYRMEITAQMKIDQIKQTEAKIVATTCANCKIQLSNIIDYFKADLRWAGVHDLVLNALEL